MSLADEARAFAQSTKPTRCKVAQLTEHHPELAAELEEAFADTSLTTAAITKALRGRYGVDAISHHSVGRHRRGDCSCGA